MSNTLMGLVDFYNLHQKLAPNEVILDVRGRMNSLLATLPRR